jgi:hypothetical protein
MQGKDAAIIIVPFFLIKKKFHKKSKTGIYKQ